MLGRGAQGPKGASYDPTAYSVPCLTLRHFHPPEAPGPILEGRDSAHRGMVALTWGPGVLLTVCVPVIKAVPFAVPHP